MYNMEISIMGYKINLEILILIGVVYLILVFHTIYGTCDCHGLIEGMKFKYHRHRKNHAHHHHRAGHHHHGKHHRHGMTTMGDTLTEGFAGANTNYGESSLYSLTKNKPVDTSSWSQPDLVVTPGQPLSPEVKNILDRPEQPIPLPEGELDLFATVDFKPECCPNTYSTSTGCACMTTGQYNYLVTRGGNNVPYSEY
jgi:hypothetical protein